MRNLAVILFWASVLVAVTFALLPHPPRVPGEPSDKIQHIIAFTVMAGLAAAAFPGVSKWRLMLWLCTLGAGIEVFQAIPALHRDSEAADWLADTLAGGAALLAAHGVERLWRARQPG
jgi:hypothetical protein